MAPEVHDRRSHDQLADVWSLGVVVLDMVFGPAEPPLHTPDGAPIPILPSPRLPLPSSAPRPDNPADLTEWLRKCEGGVRAGVQHLQRQAPLSDYVQLRAAVGHMLHEEPEDRLSCERLQQELGPRALEQLPDELGS